jgi:hypothetical protein
LEIMSRTVLTTTGTATVRIVGQNFGTGVAITAAYGPLASEYVVDCELAAGSTGELICQTAPGLGANLAWAVTVAGQISNIAPTLTSYAALTFDLTSSVTGPGAINGSTVGGQIVLIYAKNIGPLTFPSSISALYIVSYGADAQVRLMDLVLLRV